MRKRAKLNITSGLLADDASPEVLKKLENMVELQQQYNGAIREGSSKREVLDDEFHVRYAHNPIHHIETRLKSPQSIVEELIRKNLKVSTSSAEKI